MSATFKFFLSRCFSDFKFRSTTVPETSEESLKRIHISEYHSVKLSCKTVLLDLNNKFNCSKVVQHYQAKVANNFKQQVNIFKGENVRQQTRNLSHLEKVSTEYVRIK